MKSPCDVLVIGAGISGLSLAYRLQKKGMEPVLLDASSHAGGWVKTLHTDWGLLETGPRGVRLRGESGAAFLELVRDLSIEHKLIGAEATASMRYILLDGALEKVQTSPWNWPFSKATRGLGCSLFMEMVNFPAFKNLFLQTGEEKLSRDLEDVSVETFLCERFGSNLYRRLFEPALLGVFGAQGSFLSAATCLKSFWKAYRHRGGVVLGLMTEGASRVFSRKPSFDLRPWNTYPLISFEKGLQEVVDALSEKMKPYFQPKQKVNKIQWDRTLKMFRVHTSSKLWLAEKVVVACNPWSLGSGALQLTHWDPLISHAEPHSLSLLHLGFDRPLSKAWGFGYLVAPSPTEQILGVVMDSNIFPVHDRGAISRMTVMMKSPQQGQSLERQGQKAIQSVTELLNIEEPPKFSRYSLAEQAFALYKPGFEQARERLLDEVKAQDWPLHFTGVGYGSFSLAQCFLESKKLSDLLTD